MVNLTATTILLLGGSANPSGRVKYDLASDTWTPLSDLPFSTVNGACTTATIKGAFIVNYIA